MENSVNENVPQTEENVPQTEIEYLWECEKHYVDMIMLAQTELEVVRERLRELQCIATEKICESTGAPCNSPEECDNQCVNMYEKGEYNPALPISFVESGRSAVGCSQERCGTGCGCSGACKLEREADIV